MVRIDRTLRRDKHTDNKNIYCFSLGDVELWWHTLDLHASLSLSPGSKGAQVFWRRSKHEWAAASLPNLRRVRRAVLLTTVFAQWVCPVFLLYRIPSWAPALIWPVGVQSGYSHQWCAIVFPQRPDLVSNSHLYHLAGTLWKCVPDSLHYAWGPPWILRFISLGI